MSDNAGPVIMVGCKAVMRVGLEAIRGRTLSISEISRTVRREGVTWFE
jgi:hypothetical protein